MSKENRTISEVEARRLYRLLEEMNRFLHNPSHFSDPKQVEEWLKAGVYEELRHAYYEVAGSWFPIDDETDEAEGPDVEPKPKPRS